MEYQSTEYVPVPGMKKSLNQADKIQVIQPTNLDNMCVISGCALAILNVYAGSLDVTSGISSIMSDGIDNSSDHTEIDNT